MTWSKRIGGVLACVGWCTGGYSQEDTGVSPRNSSNAVVLESDYVKYTIGPGGGNVSFVDKVTGRDYCAKKPVYHFVRLKKAGKWHVPSAVLRAGDRITARFGKAGVTAVVKASVKKHYFVFELASISDEKVSEFVLSDLHLTISKHIGWASGVARNEEFAACIRALNLQALARGGGSRGGSVLRSTCYRRFGLVGARIALAGCPAPKIRAVLKEILRAEGVPCSRAGGPWALDSARAKASYLFCRPSEGDVEEWIRVAKRAGMAQIMLVGWGRYGDYRPHPSLYPNGVKGLKAVVDKTHAAGMLAGMHMHTSGIDRNGPWVRPVPDKDLFKGARFTLATAVGPEARRIPVVERIRNPESYFNITAGSKDIQIGDEIITFTGISMKPPYGFTGCLRGAHGTKRAGHKKGACASHLIQQYGLYLPAPNSALFERLTQCVANVYNTCGFDTIYFDGFGAEGAYGRGDLWHYGSKVVLATFRKFKRPACVEGAGTSHHMWPVYRMFGAWDTAQWGVKRFIDYHVACMRGRRDRELLPVQLGWWGIHGPSDLWEATTSDEIEYLCTRCLGHDMSLSLGGVRPAAKPANARQNELLTLMGQYERLRRAGYFSEAVKARLRVPRDEFRLTQADDGTWQLIPTDYTSHKVTGLGDGTGTWTARNRFATQPVKLRIKALVSAEPYDSPKAIVLADFGKDDEFNIRKAAGGVTHNLARCTERVQGREAAACYTARSTRRGRRGAWACVTKTFSPPLDLTRHGAIGVWIHGDGKGELLNVQLWNPRTYTAERIEEHYLTMDFTGWRYFELPAIESDAGRYSDYQWPYRGSYAIHRPCDRIRHRLLHLSLYYNNLPPGQEVRCYLGPIQALPTGKVKLRNPSVTIGGKTIAFPGLLESRCTIEFNSMDDCKLYDARGRVLKRITPRGERPTLAAGDSPVRFACEGPKGTSARADVTVVSEGEPFGGVAPKAKVDWDLLRWEPDAPRVVRALDGRQNVWDVLCRPDAARAGLEVEITLEHIGRRGAAYRAADAVSLEEFEDLAAFADSPGNRYLRYVHSGAVRHVPAPPGVTPKLDLAKDLVKGGKASARYSATSSTAGGWCARGRRFQPLLDLSASTGVGFWIHGDGAGHSLKLQLHDAGGAFQAMITPIDFKGWKFVTFDLAPERIELAKIEYLILFYNGLPKGTVTCHVDDIRAFRRSSKVLRDPTLTVAGRRITFPVAMSIGDRLVYKGPGDCKLIARGGTAKAKVEPTGAVPRLKPGRNRVELSLASGPPGVFRVRVEVAKVYR